MEKNKTLSITDLLTYISFEPRDNVSRIRFPKYKVLDDRVASFSNENWARYNKTAVPISEFAKYGFFYTGNGDSLQCFCCGVGIMKWEPDDNPAVEHIKWCADREDCPHVKQLLGASLYSAIRKLVLFSTPHK